MIKKNIPNILTIIRILLTPFIIYLSYHNQIIPSIILIIVASITDTLDGLIARKYNLITPLGTTLDTVADKLFAGCLIISLCLKRKLFILCLIGEIIIALINIISYFKNEQPKTEYIGKIKTTSLFITIIVGYVQLQIYNLNYLVHILIIITSILQILSIISYTNKLLKIKSI